MNQPRLRFEHRDASAFRADQRARDVETIFRQKLIQIVAGNAARNFRIFFADQIGVFVAQIFQTRDKFRRAVRLREIIFSNSSSLVFPTRIRKPS